MNLYPYVGLTPTGSSVVPIPYLYEPDSFVPVAEIHDGQLHHIHTDHLGTPLEATNDEGRITWKVTYRTWGNVITEEVQEIQQRLRFQGQYFDQETGLHYNRFRYYEPGSGRFISQDPIGLNGGINVFQYAPNPTNWVDPMGLSYYPCKCDEILSKEGVTIGRHGDVSKIGGLQDSHHVYQDAAVNGIPGYNYNDAIAVSIQGRNANGTTRGTPHYNANQVQKGAANGGLLGGESVTAYKSLKAAGLRTYPSRPVARQVMMPQARCTKAR